MRRQERVLNPKRRKNQIRRTNRLRLIFAITSIIVIGLGISFARQRAIINELTTESRNLINQQNETNKKIDELVEVIKQSNSLEYIEKRAREELGMIKKGESIYVNPEDLESSQESQNEEVSQ